VLNGTGAFGVEIYRERSQLARVMVSIAGDGRVIVQRECIAGGKIVRCRSAIAFVRAAGAERVAGVEAALVARPLTND
jgi:hypothetical protein